MNATTLANASEFQAAILAMIDGKTTDQYRLSGTPSPAFWDMWTTRKNTMKSAGFDVSKVDGQFRAGLFLRELSPRMTEEEARVCAIEKATENAFWKSDEGRAIAPGGR
mgnify:CR=1 FL=1